MYGITKGSRAEQLWFPPEFKIEFYELYRRESKKGRATSTRPAYFVPGGINKDSKNKKITNGQAAINKKEVPVKGLATRVWKREDCINDRKYILMNGDDAENCTFEPNAGTQNPHLKKILRTYPELERDEYDKERTLKDFVGKLGDKFSVSNPEIFKGGILRAARSHFLAGNLEDAIRKLSEGFKFISLKREYDPKFADEYMAIKKREVETKRIAKLSEKERAKEESKKRRKLINQERRKMKANDHPEFIEAMRRMRKEERDMKRKKDQEERREKEREKEREETKDEKRDKKNSKENERDKEKSRERSKERSDEGKN